MTNLHEDLKVAFATYIKEIENFEQNGVKVSATRARAALSDISKLITQRRKEIQEQKNNT